MKILTPEKEKGFSFWVSATGLCPWNTLGFRPPDFPQTSYVHFYIL